MPKRNSLVDVVGESVLELILSGQIKAGEALPPEGDIARQADVSRLTVREALKTLQAQNIISVRRGLGTFVNPLESWTGLEVILRAASRGIDDTHVALRLLEVRRMMETGAAELAAVRHRAEDLASMDSHISEMAATRETGDVEAFSAADIAFHDAVFRASANPLVPALMGQLATLLRDTRRATSAFPEVQQHALEHHRLIRSAIATGDPTAARTAMNNHIDQTYEDYRQFLHSGDADEETAPDVRITPRPGDAA